MVSSLDSSLLELVIFDCDGVLVDSEPIANRIFLAMLSEIGLSLSFEEGMSMFTGLTEEACMQIAEKHLGLPIPANFIADLKSRTKAAFEAELKPVAGINEALAQIKVPVCIASGGEHSKMEVTLAVTGLLSKFKGRIFSATEVSHGKPAPDLFLYAAQKMGAKPGSCVVVEDSLSGVRAGVAAEMLVLAYSGTFHPEKLISAGAHTVFHDMSKLPNLLQDLFASCRGGVCPP